MEVLAKATNQEEHSSEHNETKSKEKKEYEREVMKNQYETSDLTH